MKPFLLLFILAFFFVNVVHAVQVERVDLKEHTTAAQIAYIKFSNDNVRYDFDGEVDIICHALHTKKNKEQHVSDLDFSCVSSLEEHGLQVNVQSIECVEDVSESELVVFNNPIRLDGCFLTPEITVLPPDYIAMVDQYRQKNEWMCQYVNCSTLHITMYHMIKHSLPVNPSEHLVCGPQVCYIENASTFDFYKKLFLLFWNKK